MARKKKKGGSSTPRLLVLGASMLLLGLGLGYLLTHQGCDKPPPRKIQKKAPEKKAPGKSQAKAEKREGPRNDRLPVQKSPLHVVPAEPVATEKPPLLPRLAIVMDDFGYIPPERVRRICAQPIPFTVAVLPFMTHSRESAEIAHENGKEVLLHLPMEPRGGVEGPKDPGPGAVMAAMGETETREKVRKALLDVPWRKGVNNHMGSRITPDARRMAWVLQEVKAAKCFFLDSRTEKDSVARSVAEKLHLPVVERQVFLDDDKSFAGIKKQWVRAVEIATREGRAVIICHVYPETMEAIEKLVPAYRNDVKFVKASELLEK